MNRTKKTLALYFSDIKHFLMSPTNWSEKEYLHFLGFLTVMALCFFIDEPVRRFFLSLRSPQADMIFSVGNFYGKGYIQLLCIFVLFYLGTKHKGQLINIAHLLLESIIFSGFVTNLLKVTFGRWRPFTDHGNLHFTPFVYLWKTGQVSFPSADVSLAFSCSLIMAELYDNKLWKALWYILAIMTALGRLYHDKHWTSDVVMSTFLCFYLVKWLKTQPLFLSYKNFSSAINK
ncbi:MAG: phosphatase PAP2 family protein [Bacteroidota bacterium]|nr:phosphatase PAP2 family protein [Bacteroidota bacterium]